MLDKMIKSLIPLLLFLVFLPTTAQTENPSWVQSYQEAGKLLKQGRYAAAAESYYRAQLASSWDRELRPAAFVQDGNDPGTLRAALNQTLGAAINPWAFKDAKKRLVPILDLLTKEVEAITSLEALSSSIYGGFSGGSKEEQGASQRKYPLVIPTKERLLKFKRFANNWIAQGRSAAMSR